MWSLVLRIARSVVRSTPTTTASYSCSSKVVIFTVVLLELITTWELVMIYPSDVAIIPVPVLEASCPFLVSEATTVTVEGATLL